MAFENTKRYGSAEFLSLIIFLISVAFFFYFVPVKNASWTIKHYGELEKGVKKILQQERPEKRDGASDAPKPAGEGRQVEDTDNVTSFLKALNSKLAESGIELDNIMKPEDSERSYQLLAYASFDRLVDFLFKVEQSSFAIQNIEIHPYSDKKHLINMNLEQLSDEMRRDDLYKFLTHQSEFPTSMRDPFRKGFVIVEKDTPSEINLSWKYKLTAIGFDGRKHATIDHNTYYIGDNLHGMYVITILSDRVNLASEDKKHKYFIAFRYNKIIKKK